MAKSRPAVQVGLDLGRRMNAGERPPPHQVLAHRQATDHHRLKPDLLDQRCRQRQRILVVTGDRHRRRLALAMRQFGQLVKVDRVEGAHDMRAGQRLLRRQTGAALGTDLLDEVLAVAPRDRVADIDGCVSFRAC